jgi:DNA-binding transcriptional LysR family regulator
MRNSRIALIHATPLAMPPVAKAFGAAWPQAELLNLLDDRLSMDLAATGHLDGALVARFVALATYARSCAADAVLFTCSAFGPAIDAAGRATGLPVLKPNEAMFDDALVLCQEFTDLHQSREKKIRIGLLTTFEPAAGSLIAEFETLARAQGVLVNVISRCAHGAMAALAIADTVSHDRLVLQAARELAECDLVLLGQFSMAHLQAPVAQVLGKPVLSSPTSAVRKLRALLAASADGQID